MSSDGSVVQELRVRWSVTNAFDCSNTSGFCTVLTCRHDSTGVLYVANPSSTLDIELIDAATGAILDREHVEHDVTVHIEQP